MVGSTNCKIVETFKCQWSCIYRDDIKSKKGKAQNYVFNKIPSFPCFLRCPFMIFLIVIARLMSGWAHAKNFVTFAPTSTSLYVWISLARIWSAAYIKRTFDLIVVEHFTITNARIRNAWTIKLYKTLWWLKTFKTTQKQHDTKIM